MADKNGKKRRLKSGSYQSFRLSKRLKNSRPKLPSSWSLAKDSARAIKANWKLFGGITLIYAILVMFLTRDFGSSQDVAGVKEILTGTGTTSNLQASFTVFGNLLSGGGGVTQAEAAGVYQSIVVLLSSLATLWAFRRTYDNKKSEKIRVRDAFYKGMYPLVPVLLVSIVVGLQLLPVSIGGGIYNVMITQGLAATFVEQAFWLVIVGLLIMLSLYMLGASLIALVAVTLPDVTPIEALRGAKKYVEHRRFTVVAKLLWLMLGILVMLALIILPLIAFVPAIAEFVFFVSSSLLLPFVIGYVYYLYRALLK